MNKQLFITGIGTGIGKTITSALFTELYKAAYWKPIQSGDLHSTDSMGVADLTSFDVTIYPERHRLKLAASPHESAKAEDILIKLSDFELPTTDQNLIVEGAGGLFVPISDDAFIIDMIAQFQLPVVLVSRDYLGCINHTMLSIQALQSRNIAIEYFVFNGEFNPATQAILTKYLPTETKIVTIPDLENINKTVINSLATEIKCKNQL